jgi:hypothetical protein
MKPRLIKLHDTIYRKWARCRRTKQREGENWARGCRSRAEGELLEHAFSRVSSNQINGMFREEMRRKTQKMQKNEKSFYISNLHGIFVMREELERREKVDRARHEMKRKRFSRDRIFQSASVKISRSGVN